MKRLATATASLALAAAVGGCGSTTTTTVVHTLTRTVTETVTVPPADPATTTAPAGNPTTTTTTGTTTATNTSGGASITTASGPTPAATAACTSSDLKPSSLASSGATGRAVLTFALRNVGQSACHTYGWPGIAFAAADGSALPTPTVRTTSDLLGSTPPAELTLGPGQQASFRVIVPDSSNGTHAACHTASAVRIIAPDDTAAIIAGLRAPVTACGSATISPLLAGTDALPGV